MRSTTPAGSGAPRRSASRFPLPGSDCGCADGKRSSTPTPRCVQATVVAVMGGDEKQSRLRTEKNMRRRRVWLVHSFLSFGRPNISGYRDLLLPLSLAGATLPPPRCVVEKVRRGTPSIHPRDKWAPSEGKMEEKKKHIAYTRGGEEGLGLKNAFASRSFFRFCFFVLFSSSFSSSFGVRSVWAFSCSC